MRFFEPCVEVLNLFIPIILFRVCHLLMCSQCSPFWVGRWCKQWPSKVHEQQMMEMKNGPTISRVQYKTTCAHWARINIYMHAMHICSVMCCSVVFCSGLVWNCIHVCIVCACMNICMYGWMDKCMLSVCMYVRILPASCGPTELFSPKGLSMHGSSSAVFGWWAFKHLLLWTLTIRLRPCKWSKCKTGKL